MRVETPNGGRKDSITDLRDITWELVLSDAVLEVDVNVDKQESDGFCDLVADRGGFAGNLITRVGREEATEGALRIRFVVESGGSWTAGTEADLECVRVSIELGLVGTGNHGMFSSLSFDLMIGGPICAGGG